MNAHFFVSSCDGALHDTRELDWHKKPLRNKYKWHYAEIRTVAEYKATLRAGAYAWPGGYPLYLICNDGGALCFACGRREARNIIDSIQRDIRHNGRVSRDGWRVVACDVNYEDNDLHCEHCGKQIESAYGD